MLFIEWWVQNNESDPQINGKTAAETMHQMLNFFEQITNDCELYHIIHYLKKTQQQQYLKNKQTK